MQINKFDSMENIASHYANELDAQYGTIQNLTKHTGEIGRAHEIFLREILKRFLPPTIRISSGFVAGINWTSRQQDILLHKRDDNTLYEIGDCVIADQNAYIGAIEVKTNIDSTKKLKECLEKQAELRKQLKHRGFYAFYAWDGISYDSSIETLWNFVREIPTKRYDSMPDVIYVRNKYFLRANRDGERLSPPYHVWHIDERGLTEGQALLGLVAAIWKFGRSLVLPWWLVSWNDLIGSLTSKHEDVPWPDDLLSSVMGNK